jgi:hypothetical protein
LRRAAALLGALAALSAATALAAVPAPAPAGPAHPAASSEALVVGPGSVGQAAPTSDPARPVAAVSPVSSGGSAAQTVSGTVASSTGVALDGTRPRYVGTEPATMTVTRDGAEMTVTVVPR